MAVKSSPRGKRSKPHCLEVELVKTVFGAAATAAAAAGVVEVGRRAAAVHGRADRGEKGWMGWMLGQEEQGRLKEERGTHRPQGHHKRSNRGAVGSSRQKQERKQGKQKGKEAEAAEAQGRKEWWEMLREALQGASGQG